jgi:adenylate cyclase
VGTDAWEKAGLLPPTEEGAEERRALLEHLTERGATLDQLVEAHRLGSLPAVAGELALGPPRPAASVEEAATRLGVSLERVQRILLAAGLPTAADTRLPDDLDALVTSFELGAALMGEDPTLAFTRVLGAAATSIAEAAVALFYAELGPGTGGEGADELARARASERATLAFTSVPEALSNLLMTHFDRATRRAVSVRRWSTSSVAGAGAGLEAATGSSEVVALGFVDLVSSTAWAEGLSLRDHSLALSRFESAAWSSAVLAGGRVVKMIGDEVFFAAPTVEVACRIGAAVCEAAASDESLPPARGAVGFGPVTPREGDYFGPLVNLVSRLVKVAAPGELVVTEAAEANLPADGWTRVALDARPVRGLEAPVRVFAVNPARPQPT